MAENFSIRPFRKLLAANRSEIAIRIFRAGTELNLRTVAIFAQADRFCLHRFKADEAYLIGEDKGPVAAYLDIDSIVTVAKEKGVDAIHPGYGFLSENAKFAHAWVAAGITFVGPRPELLDMMGDKTAARALAQKINVPVLPGNEEAISDRDEAMKAAKQIGFPLIIKAAFGGGGRGMRVVQKASDLSSLLDEAQSEAERAFGNSAVFLEKYIPHAKHIEVQILGDQHGNVIHLHERDCSVQRRHQKVIEVAPSFGLPPHVVRELCDAAARMAREIRYDNAGTVEFLYDLDEHEWFFIEMNPRIQVEHTVTEVITGLDLVRAQILIAQGHALHSREVGMPHQNQIPRNGYAIQCRITTEDPENKFIPDYGRILAYRSPGGFGVRLDGGMGYAGAVITPFYDSLLVKSITSGQTYEIAMNRARRVLSEFRIRGVKTNIPFLENVLAHRAPNLFSLEMWGGATFDTAMRFLSEDPWERLRQLRARVPNICFQMLFRGANAVGYTNYPDNIVAGFVKHAAASGMDIFRVFDSLNYLPNLRVAMEAVQETHGVCEAALCYTGDILDEKRDKFSLEYYVKLARELEKMGAHVLAIKDMAGLCRPAAARKLV